MRFIEKGGDAVKRSECEGNKGNPKPDGWIPYMNR
jgi:hypothetical protein